MSSISVLYYHTLLNLIFYKRYFFFQCFWIWFLSSFLSSRGIKAKSSKYKKIIVFSVVKLIYTEISSVAENKWSLEHSELHYWENYDFLIFTGSDRTWLLYPTIFFKGTRWLVLHIEKLKREIFKLERVPAPTRYFSPRHKNRKDTPKISGK